MNFGEILWFLFLTYLLFAYLMALFAIFGDLFRDDEMGGVAKFFWIMFLIFMPFLGILIYFLARGRGMGERSAAAAAEAQRQQAAYIRTVASSTPTSAAQEIASAKALLDSGAITAAEYEALKAKSLA
ncbi:MAG TPA: SHOCT domain-containing protein [Actinotalea sp.]|nr:SHOCT domain-containing protein [Actinotalea sp.]